MGANTIITSQFIPAKTKKYISIPGLHQATTSSSAVSLAYVKQHFTRVSTPSEWDILPLQTINLALLQRCPSILSVCTHKINPWEKRGEERKCDDQCDNQMSLSRKQHITTEQSVFFLEHSPLIHLV